MSLNSPRVLRASRFW